MCLTWILVLAVDRGLEHDGSLGEGQPHGGSEGGFWAVQSSAFLQCRSQRRSQKLQQQRDPGKPEPLTTRSRQLAGLNRTTSRLQSAGDN